MGEGRGEGERKSIEQSFHPVIAAWFERKFGSPTAPQEQGWPAIQSGAHTLIAAPTGSGKTLAAFLASLDSLFRIGLEGYLPDETRVVYVSPLKALSNDIHKNLEEPLAEIRAAVPFIDALMREIDDLHPGLEPARAIHELTRRVITRFIEDGIDESRRRIGQAKVASPEAVATAGRALIGHSASVAAADRDMKAFLLARMYRHPEVRKVRDRADAIVRRLFQAYFADSSLMPPEWAAKAEKGDLPRAVADYIAGMTDRFAIAEHARLFDGASDLR